MELFDDLPRNDDTESTAAKSNLSMAFGDEMFAQLPPIKPVEGGSSVLRPPEIKPPVVVPPVTDAPPPKTDVPPPKTDAPPPKTDAGDAKVNRVVDSVKTALSKKDASSEGNAMKAIEDAFRGEADRAAMEALGKRLNDALKANNVTIDVHPFRHNRFVTAVTVKGVGRDSEIIVGIGTGRKDTPAPKVEAPPPKVDVPPTKTDAPPPKVEAPPPKVEAPAPVDAAAAKAKDVVDVLSNKANDLAAMMKKVETAFRSEPNKAGMEDLARRINEGLKGTGVSVDLHPFRNHRTNMAVTIKGVGKEYDIPVGGGTGSTTSTWRR